MKILVIEDESKLASSIQKGLEEQFHLVDVSLNGLAGKRLALVNNYDIIILDVILPEIDGFELCRQLREKKIKTPVLLLTALGSIEDKIKGFEAGADDYLVKPFEFRELSLRINALYKRSVEISNTEKLLSFADLILNLDEHKVTRAGREIELTTKEFSLLEFFLKNKGKVITRSEIAQKVWDINFDSGTNVIDVYVNFLRKKVDRDFSAKLIHTVIGRGYVLKEGTDENKK